MSLDRPVGVWELRLPDRSRPHTWEGAIGAVLDVFGWARISKVAKRRGWRVLDLRLAFSPRRGVLDEDWFTACARVRFDSTCDRCTLMLCLNMFTDQLHIAPTRMVGFAEAAGRNRARLADALRSWERVTAGRIVAWRSSRISGIDRYGYQASAAAGRGHGAEPFTPLPADYQPLYETLLTNGFRVTRDDHGPMSCRNLWLERGYLAVVFSGERGVWWLTAAGHDAYDWRWVLDGVWSPHAPSDRLDEPAYLDEHIDEIERRADQATRDELTRHKRAHDAARRTWH